VSLDRTASPIASGRMTLASQSVWSPASAANCAVNHFATVPTVPFNPVGVVGARYVYTPASHAPDEERDAPALSVPNAVILRLVRFAPRPMAGDPDCR